MIVIVDAASRSLLAQSLQPKENPQATPTSSANGNSVFLPFIQSTLMQSSGQALSDTSNPIHPQPNAPELGLIFDGLIAAEEGECAGLYKVADTGLCTHGPDLPPPGVDVNQQVNALTIPVKKSSATAVCDGDGVSGNRVQVMYVRAANRADRFAQFLDSMREWAADADDIYFFSAVETGGTRRIRFVHDANCAIDVIGEVIPAGANDTFSGMISALQAKGYNQANRKYMIFSDATVYCGIGGLWPDESAEANNKNNFGPSYGRVDSGCWSGKFAAHELMHNLGGVQLGAPNSSRGYHCTDEYDVLCYSDAPYYPAMVYRCSDPSHDFRLDCNHDDYYHTDPAVGSYLADHWNAAFNQFLIWDQQATPTATPTPSPTPTSPPFCERYQGSAPVSIFDLQTMTTTLSIGRDQKITDINLVGLHIQHTFDADLEAYLIGPDGTSVLLFQNVGVDGRDFRGTWLDSQAEILIGDGSAPFTGHFRPQGSLNDFIGKSSAGKWGLVIADVAKNDAGILLGWGLEVCSDPAAVVTDTPATTPTPTMTPNETSAGTPTTTPIGTELPTATSTATLSGTVPTSTTMPETVTATMTPTQEDPTTTPTTTQSVATESPTATSTTTSPTATPTPSPQATPTEESTEPVSATHTATTTPTTTATATLLSTVVPTVVPPSATPTVTPTATGTVVVGSLTIGLVVEPHSIQNFNFEGDLGTFKLDDAGFDDGDDHGNGRTFTLEPGVYTITERVPNTWYLVDLLCTPAQGVIADQAAHKLVVTLNAGDSINCIFRHQRNVIVRTRSFHDMDRNGERALGEAWLPRWSMTLYSQKGSLIETQLTNSLGKANFNRLLPGTYSICETVQSGWLNTQPAQLDSKLNKPCYSTLLAPGQIATTLFGNDTSTLQRSLPWGLDLLNGSVNGGGIEITSLPDVTDDEAGYGDDILVDYDAVTAETFYRTFLPLVNR